MAIPKRYTHLIGSNFTSAASFLGWRHFHIVAMRRTGEGWEAEVVSAVEPVTRTWVDAASLFDKAQWHAGWDLLKDISAESR